MSYLRCDVITGVMSVHPDMGDKPLARAERTMPQQTGGCPFCRLIEGGVVDGSVYDGGEWREALFVDDAGLSVPNRWNSFAPSGKSDLCISTRHVHGIEQLSREDALGFLCQLVRLYGLHREHYATTGCFVNVGREAGGSQPHLHGQVVSSGLSISGTWAYDLCKESVRQDVDVAGEHDSILFVDREVTCYAPFAPAASGELRVVGTESSRVMAGGFELLCTVAAVYGSIPYNLVYSEGRDGWCFLQVLLRFGANGLFLPLYGTEVIVQAPESLARSLR